MPRMPETTLSGVAAELATALADKCLETIDGFPGNSSVQRGAIARFVAAKLIAYAEKVGA